ncbi:MAG: terminase gpA endonuclease subunit [Pseudomonadota bacterium]
MADASPLTRLPRFGPPQTKGLPDALVRLARVFADTLKPPPPMDPVAWGAANLRVIKGAMQGRRWSPEQTPYWIDPLRDLSPESPVNEVVIMKAAQVGATQIATVWLGAMICERPAATMMVLPTLADALDWNREELQPTIDECPALARRIVEQKSRSGDGSSSRFKKFAGGFLTLVGANSAAGLRRRTVKYALCDDVDEWPIDVDGQGDPLAMVAARQTVFEASGEWKRLVISTPTFEGRRIDVAYEAGDRRRWHVPCPHCGHEQVLEFERLTWPKGDPDAAHMICAENGCVIEERDKTAMNGKGRWVAEEPDRSGRKRSYHVDALISPFKPWARIAAEIEEAEDDPSRAKPLCNLVKGRPYKVDGEAPEPETLLTRRRADLTAGEVPPQVAVLTCGVDVQANRLEWDVYGWGPGIARYGIDSGVFEGDTDTPEPWAELAKFYTRSYPDHRNVPMSIAAMAIDSGFRPQATYAFVRGRPNAFAVKGASRGQQFAPALSEGNRQDIKDWRSGSIRARKAVALWIVGGFGLKAELFGRLAITDPGQPGGVHYPQDDARYGLAFMKSLASERLVERETRRGMERVFEKIARQPNERLDTAVYARAAGEHPGAMRQAGLRPLSHMTTDDWIEALRRRDAEAEPAQMDLLRSVQAAPAPATDPAAIDAMVRTLA